MSVFSELEKILSSSTPFLFSRPEVLTRDVLTVKEHPKDWKLEVFIILFKICHLWFSWGKSIKIPHSATWFFFCYRFIKKSRIPSLQFNNDAFFHYSVENMLFMNQWGKIDKNPQFRYMNFRCYRFIKKSRNTSFLQTI